MQDLDVIRIFDKTKDYRWRADMIKISNNNWNGTLFCETYKMAIFSGYSTEAALTQAMKDEKTRFWNLILTCKSMEI